MLDDLLKRKLISEEVSAMLENMTDFSKELFEKQQTTAKTCSSKLRAFAVTLNFLSPIAYVYVRSSFNCELPYPRTIRHCYESVDGSPSFTKEAFIALRSIVNVTKHKVLCSLILDEKTIKPHIELSGKSVHGYINFGVDMLFNTSVALMLVAVNDSWKLPVAYFLTNSINGVQKSGLVKECIRKSELCGVTIMSVTFNENTSNISMAKDLGCKLNNLNTQPWFMFKNHKIFIFYDACSMLKLIINSFRELRILSRSDGNQINWKYIDSLIELQENDSLLHIDNNLRPRYLKFFKEKMKVKLASLSPISDSVADALGIVRKL